MTKTERFSKIKVLLHLQQIMQDLEQTHGFKTGDGYSAVAHCGDLQRKLAFGKYDFARDLFEAIDGGYI